MSPNSTSNTMLMPAALVIGSAAERSEACAGDRAQWDTAERGTETAHHSHNAPRAPKNKIMNTEEWHEEMLGVCWRGRAPLWQWDQRHLNNTLVPLQVTRNALAPPQNGAYPVNSLLFARADLYTPRAICSEGKLNCCAPPLYSSYRGKCMGCSHLVNKNTCIHTLGPNLFSPRALCGHKCMDS